MVINKNSSSNFTEEQADDVRNVILDYDNLVIKAIFSFIGFAFVLFGMVAVIALNQTRRTPVTARFLSSGLIVYDILAVLCFTIRKFIDDDGLNIVIQVTGSGFVYLAYITVGIMSLERLIIFQSPTFYIKSVTPSKVRKIVSILWLLMTVLYHFVRYGVCYIVHSDATIYDVIGKCNSVSYSFFGFIIVFVIITSIACYLKIIHIIIFEKSFNHGRRHTFADAARVMQRYKSSSMVFFYIFTITITGLSYGVIMLIGLSPVPLRAVLDTVNVTNCILDPLLYVVWYRECRMRMLMMVARCLPTLNEYIEKIRIDVFHIVNENKVKQHRECAETDEALKMKIWSIELQQHNSVAIGNPQ